MDGVFGEGALGKTDGWMHRTPPAPSEPPRHSPASPPRDSQLWLGDAGIWGAPGVTAIAGTQVTVTLWGHRNPGQRRTETLGGTRPGGLWVGERGDHSAPQNQTRVSPRPDTPQECKHPNTHPRPAHPGTGPPGDTEAWNNGDSEARGSDGHRDTQR